MINAGDFIYIDSRFDLESHIKIMSGRLTINGGLIRECNKPDTFPTIMAYDGYEWIEDISCSSIILDYLEGRIQKIKNDIRKVESFERIVEKYNL